MIRLDVIYSAQLIRTIVRTVTIAWSLANRDASLAMSFARMPT